MTDKKTCPECGKIMKYRGEFVNRDNTGEHWLCWRDMYCSCSDVWCDGECTLFVGDSWNEPYPEFITERDTLTEANHDAEYSAEWELGSRVAIEKQQDNDAPEPDRAPGKLAVFMWGFQSPVLLGDNYEDQKDELRAALQSQYNAPNVKKFQQAEANVARIRREIAATLDEIDEYGADGWHCSVCGHTMYGTDEPVEDGMCENCHEEAEYFNESESGDWD